MEKVQNLSLSGAQPKQYNLGERTLKFAKRINDYVNRLPRTLSNMENGKQFVRSGGSIGANYIEAEEAFSKKDFLMRIKISRKESKESRFWLTLTEPQNDLLEEKTYLIQEATELMRIFGSIVVKLEIKNTV